MIVGDFNGKIGTEIEGNKEEITKGGRLLMQLVKRMQMEIVNKTDKCKGLWTREEGNTKSVIDYIIVNKEEIDSIVSMQIDEEKQSTPYRKEGKRKVYTDHM